MGNWQKLLYSKQTNPALGQKRCVTVSLYGIKSLEELSKSIYLEIRAKELLKKSEKANTFKIIGKTLLRGISSFFGVNFDISEKEFNKLYKSINLTGKLIILEDLERSGIDILVIMGYINNLVEQDGVKILIVANENEILYKENLQIDEKGKETKLKVLKENAQEYRRVKEKTIRDTLIFYVDLDESIKSILNLFEYNYFDTNYDKTELVEAIENMFQQLRKKR